MSFAAKGKLMTTMLKQTAEVADRSTDRNVPVKTKKPHKTPFPGASGQVCTRNRRQMPLLPRFLPTLAVPRAISAPADPAHRDGTHASRTHARGSNDG